MLTTVLFDMGGTLEDIWYNEDTQRATCRRLLEVLRANGLEPGLYFAPLQPGQAELLSAWAGRTAARTMCSGSGSRTA